MIIKWLKWLKYSQHSISQSNTGGKMQVQTNLNTWSHLQVSVQTHLYHLLNLKHWPAHYFDMHGIVFNLWDNANKIAPHYNILFCVSCLIQHMKYILLNVLTASSSFPHRNSVSSVWSDNPVKICWLLTLESGSKKCVCNVWNLIVL